MKNARRLVLAAIALLWSVPAVQGASIIGSFQSFEDELFGMTFLLQNDSAAAGVPGTFADVLLAINGGTLTIFGGASVDAASSLTDSLDTIATPFSDGVLTFVFTPEGLPSQDFQLAFNTVVNPPVFFSYTAGGSTPPPEPIPEPATLFSIGAGVALLAARRRRRHT